MRRKFVKRSGRRPANMQWSDVSSVWSFAGISATTATALVQLQSPTSLAALTSDPPEDLTLLRIVGTYTVALSATSGQNWTLALIVSDVTWTPGATVAADNDKRLLWQRTYVTGTAATAQYSPPGLYYEATAQGFPCHPSLVTVDITPRVKVEAGKALYLVAYENVATAGTLVTTSTSMRVLYKRSGRR